MNNNFNQTATNKQRFQIVANDYFNTGGNCMVNISTVLDKQLNILQYVYVDCNNITVSTVDFIRQELPKSLNCQQFISVYMLSEDLQYDPADSNESMNSLSEEVASLLFDCKLQFIRNYCKHTSQAYYCLVAELPMVLYNQMPASYYKWLEDNGLLVTTDGYNIIVDDGYYKDAVVDSNIKEAVKLQQCLNQLWANHDTDDDEQLNKFYDSNFQIIIGGKQFNFYNSAAVFNGLYDAAQNIIDEE